MMNVNRMKICGRGVSRVFNHGIGSTFSLRQGIMQTKNRIGQTMSTSAKTVPPQFAKHATVTLNGALLNEEKHGDEVDKFKVAEGDDRVSWKDVPELSRSDLLQAISALCKVRLSGLVVITSIVGYALAPGDFVLTLNNAVTFAGLLGGTTLCVCSANVFNQWLEVPFDAQMKRTSQRPLVQGVLRPVHALGVGITAGTLGFTTLYALTNPITAALGVSNIFLYAGIYTPMKRTSTLNTWAGAVVGAVPPLMGWTAVTGSIDAGGLLLAGVLFAWQFPHFNALSWNLRADYSRAGYRMMSVVDPTGCRKVALQYAAAMIPISAGFAIFDVCDWWLVADTAVLNAILTYRAWQFYEDADEPSARKLFMTTLWHLPALMLLFLLHKNRDLETVPESIQSASS